MGVARPTLTCFCPPEDVLDVSQRWVLFVHSRSRRRMQNVSNLSILTMLVMYMMSALFGYLTFYGE